MEQNALRAPKPSRSLPATLEALQRSDPELGSQTGIRCRGPETEDKAHRGAARCGRFKEWISEASTWTALEIEVVAEFSANLRLDRLLASELSISRSRLQALHEGGKLKAHPNHEIVLRNRPKDGTRIILDLSDAVDRHAIGSAAIHREGL